MGRCCLVPTDRLLSAARLRQRGCAAVVTLAACLLLLHTFSHALSGRPDVICESAEECYRAALAPLQPATPKLTREAQTQAVVERLLAVQKQFPESVWARRASLLIGVLRTDSDPASALQFIQAAQRELPVIDDYIRLWAGDAMLRAGDAPGAAALYDSIPEAVPDTLLVTRAAYRSGTAWYKTGDCRKAVDLLRRAVSQGPQDSGASTALLNLADCQARENQAAEAQATLRQLWVNYPQTLEAREAENRLSKNGSVHVWRPSPEEIYGRAQAFLTLALNEEAAAEFKKYIPHASNPSLRSTARIKLGTALVRLKRYEQARQVFQDVAVERNADSAEATVWLARIHLRLGDGNSLLAMPPSMLRQPLNGEQRAAIHTLIGTWHDDQDEFDAALLHYEQAIRFAESPAQRAEALWRIGWVHYRTGHLSEAVNTFRSIVTGKEDAPLTPQALYWTGRALERQNNPADAQAYHQVCRQYVFTYYCQMARTRTPIPGVVQPAANGTGPAMVSPAAGRAEIQREIHYQRAVELKTLGMEQEAAAELAWLVERYAKNRDVLLELSALLSEAGAYNQALRLARANFRENLERGGDTVPQILWSVAYPTAYLPAIRLHAGSLVDPYLVAAIIREESQYDARAVSRVGAVGLMQVMPTTAQAVAKRQGFSEVAREDLFDQETNIRYGVHYLAQLLEQFSGNVVYTIASYNAGPQAVTSWIAKNSGKEPDEFVEAIPYQETRQYVKKVLRSYREYRRLAGIACDPHFLDKTC